MAAANKARKHGLNLAMNNYGDSQSYLLQPEMSPGTPTQFTFSPNYSYAEEVKNAFQGNRLVNGQNATWHRTRHDSLTPLISNSPPSFQNSWTVSRNNSLTPLIPVSSPCAGGLKQMEGGVQCSRICGNQMYGVGDLEHVRIDGLNSPTSPKMYDYADYGHQYEELPGGRKSIAKCNMDSGIDSRSEYQSSGGATDIVSETGDTSNIINEKRKRVNPLYDQMNQSMPSIYNKSKGGKDEGLRKQVRFLKCALVVFVVISLAALAISVFAVINKSNEETDPELSMMIQKLKQDYDRMESLMSTFKGNDTMKILTELLARVNGLESNISVELDAIRGQAAYSDNIIQQNTQDIRNTFSNLSEIISFLNTTIQLQLHNISKQPGPKGPQGVANFSRCSYYNVSNNAGASDLFPSFSPWAPTEVDLEKNVALFGACSVDGGTASLLEFHAITKQHVQYRCKCSGVVENKLRRVCFIHVYSCPRES